MSAYNEGYKRGYEGKSYASWGQAIGDSTVNKAGSGKERLAGHEHGQRDRIRDQKNK